MKRYIAFLRGINISGKNRIDMKGLKALFEEAGYTEVSTYLNSGNVLFSSEKAVDHTALENMIKDRYGFEVPVYVIGTDKLEDILAHAPAWWDTGNKEKYDNLIFILSNDTPEDICRLAGTPTEDLEQIHVFNDVIFWTFDRKAYQKCRWWKMTASMGIGEKLTIRTANTIHKALK